MIPLLPLEGGLHVGVLGVSHLNSLIDTAIGSFEVVAVVIAKVADFLHRRLGRNGPLTFRYPDAQGYALLGLRRYRSPR